MGQESYKYITNDMLYLPDNDQVIVRGKKLDISRLYQHIFGSDLPEEIREAFGKVCHQACIPLSRCQNDLLKMEFGEEEMTLCEACPATDVFDDNPMDANVRKLDEAIRTIRAASRTLARYNDVEVEAMIDKARCDGYKQASDDFLERQAKDEFDPVRCLMSCVGIIGACVVAPMLLGYHLAKKTLNR